MLNNHRSALLEDLTTGMTVEKYHIDQLKQFAPRNEAHIDAEASWLADCMRMHRHRAREARQPGDCIGLV